MKELHTNTEAQKSIVESVTNWYTWVLDNVEKKGTKVVDATIGHISNNNVSVKIDIVNNGVKGVVYITPQSFFIKGHMTGKTYRFKKEFMESSKGF